MWEPEGTSVAQWEFSWGMNEKLQKLTVVGILEVSSMNNIAELQVDDTLMPKPQETALHSTQKITNTIKTHQFLLRNLIQNFL